MKFETGWLPGAAVLTVALSTASCGVAPESNTHATTRAALVEGESSLTLFWDLPQVAYPNQTFWVGESLFDTARLGARDVKTVTTITGDFRFDSLSYYGDAGWMCTLASVGPQTSTITCNLPQLTYATVLSYRLTPTALGSLAIDTRVLVADVEVRHESRTVVVTTPDAADLSIGGSGPSDVSVSDMFMDSFFLGNEGPLPATGVDVDFKIEGPATLADAWWPWETVPFECTNDTPTTMHCHVDSLPMWPYAPFYLALAPTEAGLVTVTATIRGNERDPIAENNTQVVSTNVLSPKLHDLSLAMETFTPNTLTNPLRYRLTVTNNGPDPASDVQVFGLPPDGVTYLSSTTTQGWCTSELCSLGAMAANSSATVDIKVQPNVVGDLTFTATVANYAFMESDPNLINNDAVSTVTIRGAHGGVPQNKGGCGRWPGSAIDNLDDGDLLFGAKRDGYWKLLGDVSFVGWQTPADSSALPVPGGLGKSSFFAHSAGGDFDNSPYAPSSGIAAQFGCPYDVSSFRGIRFQAKVGAGSLPSFWAELPTVETLGQWMGGRCQDVPERCNDHYGKRITLGVGQWYECTVRFKDLQQQGLGNAVPLDLGAVTGIQFNSRLQNYDMSIDNVEFISTESKESTCIVIGR